MTFQIASVFLAFLISSAFSADKEKALEKKCEKGRLEDCNALAEFRSAAGRNDEARVLYEFTCGKGLAKACVAAAGYQARENNFEKAVYFSTLACELGDQVSCGQLRYVRDGQQRAALQQQQEDFAHNQRLQNAMAEQQRIQRAGEGLQDLGKFLNRMHDGPATTNCSSQPNGTGGFTTQCQ